MRGNQAITPITYGAVGDGVNDDTPMIQAMLRASARSGGMSKVIDWLGSEYVYRITEPLIISTPIMSWFGSARIKMDRRTAWCQPMVIITPAATGFFCDNTVVFDHDAQTTPQAYLTADNAFVLQSAVLVMADFCHIGGRFYNSFDSGVSFCSIDYIGTGAPSQPYTVTATRPAEPIGCSFGKVYGFNCGCGEHRSSMVAGFFKHGAAINIVTASSVNGEALTADRCYAGLVVDCDGQASAAVGSIVTRFSRRDARAPLDTGIGVFNGGSLTIGALYSSHDEGKALVCNCDGWQLTVGALTVLDSGEEGVWLGGSGEASGRFNIHGAGSITSKPAVTVHAVAPEAIEINLNIIATGTTHTYGYFDDSTGTVNGRVDLYQSGATVGDHSSTGSEVINGGGGGGGSALTVIAKTANYAVTSADVGVAFTNEGATAKIIFTLPTAVKDLTYTFIVQDPDGVTVTAAAGDTIRLGATVTAVAGNIDSTSIGSATTLVAINPTEWMAISMNGLWVAT